jgi:hypothetical protein
MRATTRIKAQLVKIDETVFEAQRLLGNDAVTKIIASESKWHDTFGVYNAEAGKVVSNRRMVISGIPVEFGKVHDAELIVSLEVEAEPVAKAAKK